MSQSQEEIKKLYQQIKKGEISKEDALKKIQVIQSKAKDNKISQENTNDGFNDQLHNTFIHYLKSKLATVLKMDLLKIKSDTPLENYGLDSVTIMQLTNELENDFGQLSKTLFFEYLTLEALSDYFMTHFKSKIETQMGSSGDLIQNTKEITAENKTQVRSAEPEVRPIVIKKEAAKSEMAIVGLAGRYPGINSIHEFWTVLKEGKNTVSKIPKERWDHALFYNPDKDKSVSGTTYCNYGGFMDEVDGFESLFFNISPYEAKYMDPQERLFLECVYNVLEDAGYTAKTLAGSSEPARVGVFVGVMFEEYQLYAAQETALGRAYGLPGNPSSIANRTSYYFNFEGPSLAMDTMCSSSLTAIHMACKSIENGDCETAIAGGVNVTIHPNKYLLLSQGKFLSKMGACASFGEGADGYVPSEGVGAILIKEKNKAIADGDHIYGIIKGTNLNHGGKSKNFTVPNPVAQSKVVKKALENAGIHPRTVSYIEAHGTGTSLGDPIEVSGLEKAFLPYSNDKQYCAIGSVKSNIGHCESAAGIAGITKVLLQMKHKLLAPSLHSGTLNKNIDFENSPFKVQQQLEKWETPVININGDGEKRYPRIAGVSAFGAGGANAHIIIEEYEEQTINEHKNNSFTQTILLSAKSDKQLISQVQNLLNFLYEEQAVGNTLNRIAYTLQIGREHHEKRLAITVKDIDQLKTELQNCLNTVSSPNIYKGGTKRGDTDNELKMQINGWLSERNIEKLVSLWIDGTEIDWKLLYNDTTPTKIALPVYPYDRQKCWMPELDFKQFVNKKERGAAYLHPLLHTNTSVLKEQRFSSAFKGNELFFEHHQINGNKTLPGVAFMEMIRKAMELSTDVTEQEIRIQKLIWLQPFIVSSEKTIHVRLLPKDGDLIKFEFYGTEDDREHLFCIGEIMISDHNMLDFPPLKDIQTSVTKEIVTKEKLYGLYKEAGLNYGAFNQGIDKLMSQDNKVLARLILPAEAQTDASSYSWHPSILDSALQACIGTKLGQQSADDEQAVLLPFGIDEAKALKSFSDISWVYIETVATGQREIQKYNLYLYDTEGAPCFYFKGFSLRSISKQIKPEENRAELCLQSVWSPLVNQPHLAGEFTKHTVMFTPEFESGIAQATTSLNLFRLLPLRSTAQNNAEKFIDYAAQVFEEIRSLFNQKDEKTFIQIIVPSGYAFEGISGALKTGMQENPNFQAQLISMDKSTDLNEVILQSLKYTKYPLLKSEDGVLYKEEFQEIRNHPVEMTTVFKTNGVYLITGGAGGLGAIFANAIASDAANSIIILTGRSAETNQVKELLHSLTEKGARAIYRSVDINDPGAVHQLINFIVEEYGELNGIIHSAGIVRDSLILRKKKQEFKEVLAPKITGLHNIDEATKNVKLDWIVLFSSVAGAFGNAGQVDYSTGNSFMDYFSLHREELVNKGLRSGKTRSINWPLWQEGGMKIDPELEKILKLRTGMIALPSSLGRLLFANSVQNAITRIIPLYGDTRIMREKLRLTSEQKITMQKESVATAVNQPNKINELKTPKETPAFMELEKKSLEYIQNQISEFLELRSAPDADANFETFGIDSVILIQLSAKLELIFGPLPKTLFFEYQNIRQLTQFFIKEYTAVLRIKLGLTDQPIDQQKEDTEATVVNHKKEIQFRLQTKEALHESAVSKEPERVHSIVQDDIAIIAVAGRYPGARNINEFWENLKNKKAFITEVPEHRWERDPENFQLGGFIDNVDQFDPLFFNINEKEATMLDPQEKLFLENTWYLLENGAYSATRIEEVTKNRVGVFVGVMSNQYPLIKSPEERLNSVRNLSSYHTIANRTSYYFNLNGPSLAVDSASSSGLTSVHLACRSLLNQECRMAITGGINLSIHASKFEALSLLGMLGTHEDCRSFGEGNGYLPSEGVGALLLKKVKDAEKDGDTILAVIKSTNINHIGRSTGYSVQSPNLQAQLIIENFERANIDPRTIGYAELAANGSTIGDAIEFVGINKAFRNYTTDNEFCAIGSVKSNLGHGEAVSGIAQITKVVLQLQHKLLVPNVPVTKKNPNISFADTPFYIQDKLQEWKAIPSDGGNHLPRRATVNSFGATGSNAHIIIEEYIDKKTPVEAKNPGPQIIVLSARTWKDLRNIALELNNHIIERKNELRLESIAKTLQLGRTSMKCRIAFVAGSIDELIEGLKAFNESDKSDSFNYQSRMMYVNQGNQDKNEIRQLLAGAEGEVYQQALFANKNYEKLALIWTQGGFDQWKNSTHPNAVPFAVLPNYSFSYDSYWINKLARLKPINKIIESKNILVPDEIEFIENTSSQKQEVVLKSPPQKRKKKDLN